MRILLLIFFLSITSELVAKEKFSLIYYGVGKHIGYKNSTDRVGYTVKDFNEDINLVGFEYSDGGNWSFGFLSYIDSYFCQSNAVYADYNYYKVKFFSNYSFYFNSKILLTKKCFSFNMAVESTITTVIAAAPSIVFTAYDVLGIEFSLYPMGLAGRIIGQDNSYQEILLGVVFKLQL